MRVAILEDDPAQADLVRRILGSAGNTCFSFASGRQMVTKLRQETYDLLILDWNVPDLTGIEIAAWVRERLTPPPPMIMVTSRSNAEDIVAGLNAGADDFLVKPIDPSVLLARVSAVMRRAYPADLGTHMETFGPITFDPMNQTVTLRGEEVQLTAKEYALALLMFRNLQRPLGRAYLLETVWGRNPDLATRTLDAHVSKIRGKLGLRPENGFKLSPVYSYGYRLEQLSDDGADSETT